MKLTKYRHACMTIEEDGEILVIDPGQFSTDFIAPDKVTTIVITHEHFDHFDHEILASIIDKNPDATIFAHESVTSKIETFTTHTVTAGEIIKAGAFTLEFHGGRHAIIHASISPVANLGVMVNELFYYPGDSFTLAHKPVDTLALPAAAPCLKIGESMDFLITIKPRLAFPVHDATLANEGKTLVDRLLGNIAEANGIQYARLNSEIEI